MVSLRWENVTASQALSALLGNYGLQLVDDSKTKIARVTVQDPAAPLPIFTKIIRLNYASPSNILTAVQSSLSDKRSRVIADTRSSQLVLVATEKEQDDAQILIGRLDTPTKQVLIEAKMLETSMNPSTTKGVDWANTLKAQTVRLGNNLQANEPQDSVNNTLSEGFPRILADTAGGFNPGTFFLDADGVTAVFSFINQNSDAKVISAPRTVTLDNETATISVIRQIPILTTSPSSANTPGSSSITYSNLGVVLTVTPRISANNTVNLKVIPEVSRVFSKESVLSGGQPNTVFTFDSRKLETSVVIPSGHTLVLGGLIQDDTRNNNTKVPLLGDLPFLGSLFRSDNKERNQNNLLIFLTPTIVEESDFQPTKSNFLKSIVPEVSSDEWSAWDSGKPYDWSKVSAKKKK
jgi:general secretion pathway protein D